MVSQSLRKHDVDRPEVFSALGVMAPQINQQVQTYGGVKHVPAARTQNLRNGMYLVYDALRLITEDKTATGKAFPNGQAKAVTSYRDLLEKGTRFIPTRMKITVALALGLGTMVGWKRIVVTVGERIGKIHLTYAMGASAEIVAASTILLAEVKGMPVSTTHILSSGVAGAAADNGSCLQWGTVRSIAAAWFLTLPAAMALAGGLYRLFLQLVHVSGLR